MHYDVLILGAGAAGLLAARELAVQGYATCLLEATAVAGGRIATITGNGFSMPVETGAEFIHGHLPITINLLKEAGLSYEGVGGKMTRVQNSVWLEEQDFDEGFELLAPKLENLAEDRSIGQFLDEYFPAMEYDSLRKSVQQFAEGFGLADTSRASVFSFRDEQQQLQDEQYRVRGGYQPLVNYLLNECKRLGAVVHFLSPVKKIEHGHGKVTVHTDTNSYSANKVIVTASLGVLQSGSIQFIPALKDHEKAFHEVGFGSVVKFLLEFREPAWPEGTGFLITDEAVPTWWTQLPGNFPLLTGWLGGPAAAKTASLSRAELFEMAIASLARIFHADAGSIRDMISHYAIVHWDRQPYVRGGYSYNMVDSANAKKILSTAVHDTIFFAGEAIYTGDAQGTVEAAFDSAKRVVQAITQQP